MLCMVAVKKKELWLKYSSSRNKKKAERNDSTQTVNVKLRENCKINFMSGWGNRNSVKLIPGLSILMYSNTSTRLFFITM